LAAVGAEVLENGDGQALFCFGNIVRDLEEEVKARLKRRAARHGHSMEEEIRHILRDAVKE
jgi:hypothetical protein